MDGSDHDPPLPVVSGGVVPECAWPTAVAIYFGDADRCSGVYVGGRVVLTAAHCIPSDFVVSGQACSSDDDCPDVSFLNGAVTLECNAAELECRDPDPLITNAIVHVQFGSEYERLKSLDGNLPRKSIQVEYCKQVANVPPDPLFPDSNDFGYCLLTEAPNLQAIPISTPCENEAELDVGTELVAVGFGQYIEGDPASGGTKRWATATLADDWTSKTDVLDDGQLWTSEGGISVSLAHGDSGGPLFAHMSDGTWRVVGIARTSFSWVIPFNHIAWLESDPNFDIEDILPCHDITGSFVGGANCGASPTLPGAPSGQWHSGSHACHTETVLQMSSLCLAALQTGPDGPRLKTPIAPAGADAPKPSGAAAGCRITGSGPLHMSFGLLILLLMKRRQS